MKNGYSNIRETCGPFRLVNLQFNFRPLEGQSLRTKNHFESNRLIFTKPPNQMQIINIINSILIKKEVTVIIFRFESHLLKSKQRRVGLRRRFWR